MDFLNALGSPGNSVLIPAVFFGSLLALGALMTPGAALAMQTAECRFDQRCDADGLCQSAEIVAKLERSTPIDAVIGFRLGETDLGLQVFSTESGRVVLGGEHAAGAFALSVDETGANAELLSLGLDGETEWLLHGACGEFRDA
ncbi:hypothetical protein [Pararhodobacter aggregans]|uniref:hypothetical protein n=1 Tax=Pararhodobacter aggregans TaxID=404875 RepID=UPI003A920C99